MYIQAIIKHFCGRPGSPTPEPSLCEFLRASSFWRSLERNFHCKFSKFGRFFIALAKIWHRPHWISGVLVPWVSAHRSPVFIPLISWNFLLLIVGPVKVFCDLVLICGLCPRVPPSTCSPHLAGYVGSGLSLCRSHDQEGRFNISKDVLS